MTVYTYEVLFKDRNASWEIAVIVYKHDGDNSFITYHTLSSNGWQITNCIEFLAQEERKNVMKKLLNNGYHVITSGNKNSIPLGINVYNTKGESLIATDNGDGRVALKPEGVHEIHIFEYHVYYTMDDNAKKEYKETVVTFLSNLETIVISLLHDNRNINDIDESTVVAFKDLIDLIMYM
jgi:uncharacterized protein YigE (DUF2233 family)